MGKIDSDALGSLLRSSKQLDCYLGSDRILTWIRRDWTFGRQSGCLATRPPTDAILAVSAIRAAFRLSRAQNQNKARQIRKTRFLFFQLFGVANRDLPSRCFECVQATEGHLIPPSSSPTLSQGSSKAHVWNFSHTFQLTCGLKPVSELLNSKKTCSLTPFCELNSETGPYPKKSRCALVDIVHRQSSL